jgi:2-aminobenzoate-CoA ligase
MPMLRTQELGEICTKARVSHALCDHRLLDELASAMPQARERGHLLTFGDGVLEGRMAGKSQSFIDIDTSSEDVCLLAFTSGTTGKPKATMHFHRDILAMADLVGGRLLDTSVDDVHLGSPPFAFTFGLGALLVFPLRFGAAAALIEQPSPEALLSAIQKFCVTALFTAPTMYRNLAAQVGKFDVASLRRCISAGEPLPKPTSDLWHEATGIRLIDGIGSTEMIHIFISAKGDEIRPGATGKPLPGYEAVVLDDEGKPMTRGVGRLAVRGPTGCRYLDDDRQKNYVVDGWNVTGDRYRIDEDGYFWFEARTDDMIISAGYNIAGPEVEVALLTHPAVREVAVIGAPDAQRGQVVKAVVVLNEGYADNAAMARTLQDHVKQTIAPYKYPRIVEFVGSLPKTQTGKIQRFALRQRELAAAREP